MTNATGIDVSAFQSPLTEAALAPYSFAYCKATEGVSITDPNLGVNWPVLGSWGSPRGCYHEFVPSDDAASQALYMHQAVVSAGGFRTGDMAAVVASDYAGTTGAEIEEFCDQLESLAGDGVTILVYSDLSVLPSLGAVANRPLWVSWPNATPPVASQLSPWGTWTFWQNGISGTDTDQYNGDAAELAAWLGGTVTIPGVPATWLSMPVPFAWANGDSGFIGYGTDGNVWMAKYSSGAWTSVAL